MKRLRFLRFTVCAILSASVSGFASELFAATNAPLISLTREGAQVRINYTGTLQFATTLGGPWSDLTNASNP